MGFKELLCASRVGDSVALEQLLKLYQPLLIREAMVEGVFDQELYHELCAEFIKATKRFDPLGAEDIQTAVI